MPHKDPAKRRDAARHSMRRKRSSPEAKAEERRQKGAAQGASRSSTVTGGLMDVGVYTHDFIDPLSYNAGHAECGKPRRGDLKSARVRRYAIADGADVDRPSDYHRRLMVATQSWEAWRAHSP